MKRKLDAATLAHHEMLRAIPEKEIQEQLRMALSKAKLWYKLHGKKFQMPKEIKRNG